MHWKAEQKIWRQGMYRMLEDSFPDKSVDGFKIAWEVLVETEAAVNGFEKCSLENALNMFHEFDTVIYFNKDKIKQEFVSFMTSQGRRYTIYDKDNNVITNLDKEVHYVWVKRSDSSETSNGDS